MRLQILLWILFVTVVKSLIAQLQLGGNMNGLINEKSGTAISMPDQNTIAIGAPAEGKGKCRVYRWTGVSWEQKGPTLYGEYDYDEFGYAVSMPDPNTVAVGAINNSGNGVDAGHVRVFSYNGFNWHQKGSDINGEGVGDNSGYAVCMPDENTVAIGAINNYGFGYSSGHVRVYRWVNNSWVQKGIDINGETANNFFGCSISMPDANTICVGARGNSDNGVSSGKVKVYSWNGNAWIQKGQGLVGESAEDNAGISVSMPDQNTIAFGAPWNGGGGFNQGHVRVFKFDGSSWVQLGSDIDGVEANAFFGYSIDMPDSITIAVAAPNSTALGFNGSINVFEWNGLSWDEIGLIGGIGFGSQFGWSVSMPRASIVGSGAPMNSSNGVDAGQVKVYTFCSIDNSTTLLSTSILCNYNGATSYQWIDCDTDEAIPGANNGTFTPTVSGSYQCQIIDGDCYGLTPCVYFDVTNLSELELSSFEIISNPVSSELRIKAERTENIVVVDVNGKSLKSERLEPGLNVIDFSRIRSGFYYVFGQNGHVGTVIKF